MSKQTLLHLLNFSLVLLIFILVFLVHLYRLWRQREEEHMGFLLTLSSLVELKDPYTEGHCGRVRNAISYFGVQLGLSTAEVNEIIVAATLHDIGKVGVPDKILNKPGKLTDQEYLLIREHAVWGYDVLKMIKRYQNSALMLRHHHEHFDGTGYPDGLAGEAIPLGSRIIAVLDSYDAMTSDRAYRKALSPEQARKILLENSGKQFDPRMVQVFLGCEAGFTAAKLDPVCGMPGSARIYAMTGGRTVFFCSAVCRETYMKDPAKYLKDATLA